MGLTEHDITINGVNVHYLEAGSGNARPVILLHGGVGDAHFHWPNLMNEMRFDYHLFAPDLPGFGASAALPQMTYTALIAWLQAFYQHLELEQAVLVGNSFGGLLARLYAAAYPQDVPALILINGGSLPPKPAPLAKVLASIPGVNRLFFGAFSRQGVTSREALEWVLMRYQDDTVLTDEMIERAKASASGLATLMQMQVNSTLPEERVPRIPTLLLWGEQDTFSPVKVGKNVNKAIPGSQINMVADTKHTPHIEEPDVIAFQIQSFLDNMGRPDTNLGGAGMLN